MHTWSSVFYHKIFSRCTCLLIGALIVSCNSPINTKSDAEPINESELCYIHFYKIDNRVEIYIDDELVHDTGYIRPHGAKEQDVSLSGYLDLGDHKLEVKLFNGEGNTNDQFDKHWQIHYEIFVLGDPIDFINEKSQKNKATSGLVWSMEHHVEVP